MSDYSRMIDVSAHQANIDWGAVKNSGSVDAVIMRCGISTRKNGNLVLNKDSCFDKNYRGAKENFIPVGVYYYSHALNTNEAVKEAEFVIDILKNGHYEFPVYYDVEKKEQLRLGKSVVSNIVRAFLSKVESAGYWVGIYGSRYPLVDYIDEDIRNRYAVWVAHIGVQKTSYPGAYGIWQYSWTGRISGINGDVDLDRCYVDYPSKIRSKGLNGFTATTPASQEEQKQNYTNPYSIPTRTLRKGDSGDDVRWMQNSLIYLGYNCGNSGADGSFGNNTDMALRAFQSNMGLSVDGACGPATRAAIISATGQSQQEVKHNTFTQRLTRPEAGNKFFITRSAGGWSTAIVGRPTDGKCNVLSNCVGYAFGRFNEILHQILDANSISKLFKDNGGSLVDLHLNKDMPLLAPRNAENFYDVAIQQGLTVSQTPRVGAIMCWQKGSTRTSSDGAGHVAVVERVVSSTEVVTSESGYNCSKPFWTQNRKKSGGNWGQSSAYKFLGFILNPAVK